jgi:hypothetical protein
MNSPGLACIYTVVVRYNELNNCISHKHWKSPNHSFFAREPAGASTGSSKKHQREGGTNSADDILIFT